MKVGVYEKSFRFMHKFHVTHIQVGQFVSIFYLFDEFNKQVLVVKIFKKVSNMGPAFEEKKPSVDKSTKKKKIFGLVFTGEMRNHSTSMKAS